MKQAGCVFIYRPVILFIPSSFTWFIISANWGSLLSSTRFSHVMSRIQRKGLGGHAFRSRAAPPGEAYKAHINPVRYINHTRHMEGGKKKEVEGKGES